MEQESWLASSWKLTERGRKAKYYAITDRGRAQLEIEKKSWDRLTRGVAQVLAYS
jgi:DNA-binding PadR family transcriptional regulator